MYPLFISLKYMSRARSTLFSVGGVMIGVAVIVVVMSIMNGYIAALESFVRSSNADLVIRDPDLLSVPYSDLSRLIRSVPGVRAEAGHLAATAELNLRGSRWATVGIRGIDPVRESQATEFGRHLGEGVHPETLFDPALGAHQILLGSKVFDGEPVKIGDTVSVTFAVKERTKQVQLFRICGFYNSGFYSLDKVTGFVPLATLQDTLGTGEDRVSSIHIAVKEGHDPSQVKQAVRQRLGGRIAVAHWSELPRYKARLEAVKNDRGLLFGVSMVVVLISGFVVMARLFLTVYTKTRDIGILRALGGSDLGLVTIFLTDGLIIGLLGAGVGVGAGKLFAANIMTVAKWIEQVFEISVFPARVYQFEQIPIELNTFDTAVIAGAAVVGCLLFSLFPAALAVMKKPVEALRYE